jgi:hypothetical protein
MLDQQEHVLDAALPPILDEGALQRQRLGVRHEAEAANL